MYDSMSSEHTISIPAADRQGAHRTDGTSISIPIGDLLTSNGLVTGQSGAEPSESVHRLLTSLLDAGETVFVVDPTGTFDALSDEPTVLHVGGDRNCDVQVAPDAVDRVASLALDGNTSIVLDLSAYEAGARNGLLGGLTDELVDADTRRHGDMLLVVDECHRWLDADGPATRTGENVVRLGGHRHDGVGILGITDQPADVRSDVLTGVDWLLAHRVTWREDVTALEQLLDADHAAALSDLDDREALFTAGWQSGVNHVRFDEQQDPTSSDVDRSAEEATTQQSEDTTLLDDGDDLLAGLPGARSPGETTAEEGAEQTPSESEHSTTGTRSPDENGDRRDDLASIENRLTALEARIDAREDVEALAERLASAIEGLQGDGTEPRTGSADAHERQQTTTDDVATDQSGTNQTSDDSSSESNTAEDSNSGSAGGFGDVFDMFDDDGADATVTADDADTGSTDTGTVADASADSPTGRHSPQDDPLDGLSGAGAGDADASTDNGNGSTGGMSFEPIDFGFDDPAQDIDSTVPDDFGPPSRHGSSGRTIPSYLRRIVRNIEEMDVTTRRMLAYYVDEGTESPMDAHFSAGGGGDRTRAYAHNRQLRTNGLIEHVGKGQYAPRLREYVVDEAGHSVPEHELDRAVEVIRQAVEAA